MSSEKEQKKPDQPNKPNKLNKPDNLPPQGYYYPPPYPYPPYPYPEEDEINLLDYIKVLWKYKFLIISIVIFTGIGSVFYAKSLPNIYRSDTTIIPRQQEKTAVPSAISALGAFGGIASEMMGLGGGGSLDKFEVVLKSRTFATKIYEAHKDQILPGLYEDAWDAENKKWHTVVEKPPTVQDIIKAISGFLTIKNNKKTGTLVLQVEHTDPAYAKKVVEYYLKELSDTLRHETLKNSDENQKFLRSQLNQIADVLLKEKNYTLLAKEIEKETFARAQNPYSFQILDPPIVPDLNKKVKPKRSQICMLSVVVAGFLGIFLAFFIEYVKNVKSQNIKQTSNSDS